MLRTHIFRRVTIIGVGFMGGSLGMALKKQGLAREVVGISSHQETLDRAIKAQAIDLGFTDVREGVANAELVVLATPVQTIIECFSLINPHLRRGCLVTDMGSVKSEVVMKAENLLTTGFFVGSHPLTGSEKSGVEHAHADLFQHARCIMTPTVKTNPVVKEKIKFLWTKLGMRVDFLSPDEHDKIFAQVSHLPHLLAYALMESIPSESLGHALQGFKDLTRIASSPPSVWDDICLTNAQHILHALDGTVKQLAFLRKAIIQRDQKNLFQFLTRAKEKRDTLH